MKRTIETESLESLEFIRKDGTHKIIKNGTEMNLSEVAEINIRITACDATIRTEKLQITNCR